MSKIITLLQSRWMAALIGGVVFTVTWSYLAIETMPAPAPVAARVIHLPQKPLEPNPPSWLFHNPELDLLVEELQKKRTEVTAREAELADLERRLKTERAELDQVLATVRKMQADMDRDILTVQEEEFANLKKLAKVYAAMDPASAVTILTQMDDATLVRILMFMREAETAPILETLAKKGEPEARRAAGISESLRLAVAAKPGAGNKP